MIELFDYDHHKYKYVFSELSGSSNIILYFLLSMNNKKELPLYYYNNIRSIPIPSSDILDQFNINDYNNYSNNNNNMNISYVSDNNNNNFFYLNNNMNNIRRRNL